MVRFAPASPVKFWISKSQLSFVHSSKHNSPFFPTQNKIKGRLSVHSFCLPVTDQEAMLGLPKGFGISVILLLNDFNRKHHFSHGVERNEEN